MNIPKPLLQIALNFALKNAGSVAAAPLEKVPYIDVIAKAYEANEPLEVIVGLFLQATEGTTDDEIAAKVGEVIDFVNTKVPMIIAKFSTQPAKEVVAELLGGLSVPDFDDNPENNRKVIDIINDTMKELA